MVDQAPEEVEPYRQAILLAAKMRKRDPDRKVNFGDKLGERAEKLEGLQKLERWDFAYYSEKLKKEKYNFDAEKLRPYFPVDAVLKGCFQHCEKLFGLSFKPASGYSVYHPEVQTFEVVDTATQKPLGLLYADHFPYRQMASARGIRRSPLHEHLKARDMIAPGAALRVYVATRPVDCRGGRQWFAEGSAYFHGSPEWCRVGACPGRQ